MRICLYTTTALPKIGGQEMAVDALAPVGIRYGPNQPRAPPSLV